MAWKIGTAIRPCEAEGKCGSEFHEEKLQAILTDQYLCKREYWPDVELQNWNDTSF